MIALGLASCGGGPALKNVPQPNTSAAAGVFAAAATAATLADPGMNRTPEKKTPEKSNRPVAGGGTVPSDVLDRLDARAPLEEEALDVELTADEIADAPPLPPPIVREP